MTNLATTTAGMDLVLVKCMQCDAQLCELTNLWYQIGKRYITPVAFTEDPDQPSPVLATGGSRFGDPGTLVEGCELQDAECEACQAHVGQKCLNSPVNHILNDGQIVFRITSIFLKSSQDQQYKPEPKVQRVLKLRGGVQAAQESSTQPDPVVHLEDQLDGRPTAHSFDILQLQADLEVQQQEIQRIGATGFQVMTSFDTAIAQFELQVKQLNGAVDSIRQNSDDQHQDLRSLKKELSDMKWKCQNDTLAIRLDQQLQTTDRVVGELRQAVQNTEAENAKLKLELTSTESELKKLRDENITMKLEAAEAKQVAQESIATTKTYASELLSLRRELKQLRSELAHGRSSTPITDHSSLTTHQLDILTSNIAKIGNRASQIESLQMEFEIFRTRVQGLESKVTHSPRESLTSQAVASAASRYGTATRQKRHSIEEDDILAFDPNPRKRVSLSADHYTVASADYLSGGEEQPSSPPSRSTVHTPIQDLERVITAEKPAPRRRSWKSKK